MNKDYLIDAINEISDKYIEEAASIKKKSNKRNWYVIGLLTACLLLFCIITISITMKPKYERNIILGNESNGNANEVISASYVAPTPGTTGYQIEVNKAREAYGGSDVEFLLTFDLFSEYSGPMTENQKKEEYQRLTELGYQLFETEYWTYYGNHQKEYRSIVVGLFTEEQLISFDINPKYGYFFRFVNNGDSSSLEFDKDNAIKLYSGLIY